MTMYPAVERHGLSHDSRGEDPVPGIIPLGGIIMWSGVIADIPSGWALCDGNNGTPNLADRFIVGAGSTYSPGATGGAASQALNLTHSGTAVAAHPPHTHTTPGLTVQAGTGADAADHLDTGTNIQSLTHTVTQPNAHSTTIATLPPYYALAFIMRIG